MNSTELPAFTDNHTWMRYDGQQGFVVDPEASAPVESALNARALRPADILGSDGSPKHAAHAFSVETQWAQLCGSAYACTHEAGAEHDVALAESDAVDVPGCRFQAPHVRRYTAEDIAFFCESVPTSPNAPMLYCGGRLFAVSWGSLLEGVVAQIHGSLLDDKARCRTDSARRRADLPFDMECELEVNPLLRCFDPPVVPRAPANSD